MKKFSLVFFLGSVATLALAVWLPSPASTKIAKATTFAGQVEQAKRIHPDTRLTIKKLVAGLRATEHLNPALELKRQSAVERLEAVLVTADGPSFEVSSQSR
jgi:hypothetical protein